MRRSLLAFTAAAAVTSFAFAPSVTTLSDIDPARLLNPLAYLDGANQGPTNGLPGPADLVRSVENIPAGEMGTLEATPIEVINFAETPVFSFDIISLTGTRHPSIPDPKGTKDADGNLLGGIVRGGAAKDLGTFVEFYTDTVDGVDTDIAIQGVNDMGALLWDVTSPVEPELLSILNCGYHQADVGSYRLDDGRMIVAIGGDDVGEHEDCMSSPISPYFKPGAKKGGSGQEAMVFFDVTDPRKPEALSAVATTTVAIGAAHTIEMQPNLPYAYIVTALDPRIEVVDFSDPVNPSVVATVVTQGSPHAFRVSDDGTRGYSAGSIGGETLSIHDMTDPTLAIPLAVQPTARNIYTHEALPAHDKSFVLVLDEGGYDPGYENGYCPGTGFWYYDLTVENTPIPMSYTVADIDGQTAEAQACASHYGNLSHDDTKMTMAYYGAGVRVFDLTDPLNPEQIGAMMFADSDVWTAKSYKDGEYVFVSDLNRGFEVYQWTGEGSLANEVPASVE